MKHTLLLTGLIAFTLSGAAVAQGFGPHPGMGGPFALFQFDGNADGRLTRAEFDAGQKARFDEMDPNRDGVVTSDERRTQMEARRKLAQDDRFAALNIDKNGALSPAELENPDGRRGGARGPGGLSGPAGMTRGRGPGPGPVGAPGGELTFAAFAERGATMFERADTNKDGVVTLAEVQAQHPKR